MVTASKLMTNWNFDRYSCYSNTILFILWHIQNEKLNTSNTVRLYTLLTLSLPVQTYFAPSELNKDPIFKIPHAKPFPANTNMPYLPLIAVNSFPRCALGERSRSEHTDKSCWPRLQFSNLPLKGLTYFCHFASFLFAN